MRCAADRRTLERITASLRARCANAGRTAELHGDPGARRDARVRLDAYTCALDDVERIARDELRDPSPPF